MRVLDLYPFVGTRFGEPRETQGGLYVDTACPLKCHRTATVRWWVWGEAKALCLRCWAGCDKLEVLRSAGLSWKDCFPADTDWKRFRPRQEVVARYSYRDELGGVLYQTLRLEPGRGGRDKEFRQRRPLGGGRWEWSLGDARRVLYMLPDLVDRPAATVVVVAGEKDVESVRGLGCTDHVATTNVGGESAAWLDAYSETLAGRDVVIVEDRDSAGRRHAHEVAGSLMEAAAAVRRVRLPDKDVTAFLNRLRRSGVTDRGDLKRELLGAIYSPGTGGRRWEPAAEYRIEVPA